MHRRFAACVGILLSLSFPGAAEEAPKRGGTLTYMIPADAPPSFDGCILLPRATHAGAGDVRSRA